MSYIQLSASPSADYSAALALAQRGYVLTSPEQAQALGLARTSSAVSLISSPSSVSLTFTSSPAQATLYAPAQPAPASALAPVVAAAPATIVASPAPLPAPAVSAVAELNPAQIPAAKLCPCGCGYEIRASSVLAEPAALSVEAVSAVTPIAAAPIATPITAVTPIASAAQVALVEQSPAASAELIYADAAEISPPVAFIDGPAQAPEAIIAPKPILAVEPVLAPALPASTCPLKSLPPLPPVNALCYAPPLVEPGLVTSKQVQLPTEERFVETNDADVQTVVRENNNYTTFNQTLVTTVNRNHLHTQRVITNENQFNTHVTNNVIKVNDIHRQQVEHIAGETRIKNDFKETTTVEQPRCLRASGNSLLPCNRS